jgi:hypothetical protein
MSMGCIQKEYLSHVNRLTPDPSPGFIVLNALSFSFFNNCMLCYDDIHDGKAPARYGNYEAAN